MIKVKMLKLTKIIVSTLVIVSVLILNPIGASAEWEQDNQGWWYTEGSSWSVGWKLIDWKWYYFGEDGYMKTGWIKYDSKSYYLNSDGSMAHDTTIDGCAVGSDGAWNQIAGTSSIHVSKVNPNATTISGVTGIKFDDITKIVFCDGSLKNNTVTIEDKQKIKEFMGYLDAYSVNNIDVPVVTGWLHRALFYINDKEVMDISFDNPIDINGEQFNVTKGNLDIKTIDRYLKSIDSSYIEH
ncbi:cell wall binding repeat-containing protein [Clostridium sp. DL-VIII]|uniref:cell wall binding repeat-containing protein n=1 Tax=Clostridium sp. DL-VIII TaxID=641107 RepID=UPI00023AF9C2|nr:cell wall binding repeat-containing protein [Clostridium sp. DL-VIII]EHI98743.1 cell wall binding repeat-containing protein [Clostridium sp. DL-VIII]